MLSALLVATAALAAPADVVSTWHDLDADGASLRYLVVRPDDDLSHPVVLALPPGDQTEGMVEYGVDLYWRALAERGWIVVSPTAPDQGLLFGAGSDAIGPLLDAIDATLPIEGRVHVAGPSNGGRAAFRAAFDHAPRVASLTAMPGFPADDDLAQAHRLAGLPVAMFVGAADYEWLARMETARDALRASGVEITTFRRFPDEGHVPPSLTGELLAETLGSFADLERARLDVIADAEAVIDDLHLAASEADLERYFGHFTADAVFLGTDATERWDVAEFEAYAAPIFASGSGWTYTPIERHVSLSADGRVAWFDERLHNDKYGETRGSGVLVRRGPRWRIAQYVLSIPVPNDLAPDLVERIAEHEAEGGR